MIKTYFLIVRGISYQITCWDTVADPGFSPGGAPTPKVGVLTYFFGQKLHENERIWTPRGGARPWRPPLDPPLG